ncbi:Dihydrolipoyllysine-residue acetyltransferase component of pyruvate dehydrogenase complex [bacterium HR13]|nr:Dihydrolipoyllysine-residue acetyltransferase component of pyruvate dehydrogenase complex [bacterium HR13]
MDYEVVMPQFSDTMERGKVVRWLKKEGDYVEKGEVLAEIEAEKAVMELQSFRSGILKKITVNEGEEVPVKTTIAIIELTEKRPVVEKPPEIKKPEEKPVEKVVEKKVEEIKPVERIELPPGLASAYAKVLASQYGIDLQELQKEGRLPSPAHEKDIMELLSERYFTPKALETLRDYHLDPIKLLEFFKGEKITEDMLLEYIEEFNIPKRVPISSVQKSLIANLTRSIKHPHFRIYETFDLSLIPWDKDITLTHWLIKIVGDAMMYFDRLRATVEEDHYLITPNADVGVAISVDDELYAPVIRKVNKKSLLEIAKEARELREKAQAGKLTLEDVKGGTLTISNMGMFGIASFDAVIPYGQVCIISVGALDENGRASINFTFDHRAVNGTHGALFVKHLKEKVIDRNYIKSLRRGL